MAEKAKMRFTDDELSVMKNSFAENEGYLKTIRKFFLQGRLTIEEQAAILNIKGTDLHKVLRKTLLPEIDTNAPMFQLADLWMNINTKEKSVEDAMLEMEARQIMVDYLEGQFEIIDGKKKNPIDLLSLTYNKDKTPRQAFIEMSARNSLLQHIDFQLFQLQTLAGLKSETLEQTKERLLKDSSK